MIPANQWLILPSMYWVTVLKLTSFGGYCYPKKMLLFLNNRLGKWMGMNPRKGMKRILKCNNCIISSDKQYMSIAMPNTQNMFIRSINRYLCYFMGYNYSYAFSQQKPKKKWHLAIENTSNRSNFHIKISKPAYMVLAHIVNKKSEIS